MLMNLDSSKPSICFIFSVWMKASSSLQENDYKPELEKKILFYSPNTRHIIKSWGCNNVATSRSAFKIRLKKCHAYINKI